MLTKEQNKIICSVGPGTSTGKLFRSIWLPALQSAQLSKNAGPPMRLKLLGEELVAFRDGNGQVGIVQSQCAHRLAPLFFGRVELQGIRCSYHGWLYDTSGQCLEIPSQPTSNVCKSVKIREQNPVQRLGQPEDCAALVCFLASTHSGFINGATIPIDGGRREYALRPVGHAAGSLRPDSENKDSHIIKLQGIST